MRRAGGGADGCGGVGGEEEEVQWRENERPRSCGAWRHAPAAAALAQELADEARWLHAEGFHRGAWVKCVAAALLAARGGSAAAAECAVPSRFADVPGAVAGFLAAAGAATSGGCSAAADLLLDAAYCVSSLPHAPLLRLPPPWTPQALPAAQALAVVALLAVQGAPAAPPPSLLPTHAAAAETARLRAVFWLASARMGSLVAGAPLLRRGEAPPAEGAAAAALVARAAAAAASGEAPAADSAADADARRRLASLCASLPLPRGVVAGDGGASPAALSAEERARCWRVLT